LIVLSKASKLRRRRRIRCVALIAMKRCLLSPARAVEGRTQKKASIVAGAGVAWRESKRPNFQNASCAVMEIVLEWSMKQASVMSAGNL
jgi:hypothetical protein